MCVWIICLKVCLKPVKILKHKPFSPKSLISLFWRVAVDRTDLMYGLWCEMWYESADINLLLLSIFCLCCESFALWHFHVSDWVITSLCAFIFSPLKRKSIFHFFYSFVLRDQRAMLTEVLLVTVVVYNYFKTLFRIKIGDQ